MTGSITRAGQQIRIREVTGKKYTDVPFTLSLSEAGSGDGEVAWSVPEGNGVLELDGNQATIIGVGEVEVTAVKAQDTNYKEASAKREIRIAKADAPVIVWPDAEEIIYGQTLSESILSGGSTEYGSFAWEDEEAVPKAGADGAYPAVFTPSAATLEHYEEIIETVKGIPLHVAKKPVEAVVKAEDKIYDGSTEAAVSAEIAGTDVEPGDSITIAGLTGTFTDADAGTDKVVDIDAAGVQVTGTNADCYEILYPQTVSAAIGQAQGILNIPETTVEKEYRDQRVALGCTTNGDGTITYKSSDESILTAGQDGTVSIHKTGTAVVTVSLAAGKNYTGAPERAITVNIVCTHVYQTVVEKAAPGQNGRIAEICSICKDVRNEEVIHAPKTVQLPAGSPYRDYGKTPRVTVRGTAGGTIPSSCYEVIYKGKRDRVGTFRVEVKLHGNYSGTLTETFDVIPKRVCIRSLKREKKGFTVTWSRRKLKMSKKRVDGYQLQYSTSPDFKSAKKVNITGYMTNSRKVTGLKAKKKYYVRMRTYMKVGGKKYYSHWSDTGTVKTKR